MNHFPTNDYEHARVTLLEGDFTCVLCQGDIIKTSKQRGVKPLVTWLMDDCTYAGFSAADKVVGRATAFLYCLLGTESIFAGVISKPALEVLKSNGIRVQYNQLVDHIMNRNNDGICPFESAVTGVLDPVEALSNILEKMKQMGISPD